MYIVDSSSFYSITVDVEKNKLLYPENNGEVSRYKCQKNQVRKGFLLTRIDVLEGCFE